MTRNRINEHVCRNCGYDFEFLQGVKNYCPNCGQENHDPRKPLVHYISELGETLFHFDNKTWSTLRTLIFGPGQITRDYIENKRARYTPPVRMFIFSLAVFIVCLELTTQELVKQQLENQPDISLSDRIRQLPDGSKIAFSDPFFRSKKLFLPVGFLRELKEANPLNFGEWLGAHQMPSGFIYRMYFRFIYQDLNTGQSQMHFLKRVTRVHYWIILFILPLSALWIFVFFHRKNLLYYDTLIMTLHFYCFSQLLGSVLALLVFLILILGISFDTSGLFFIIFFASFFFNMLPAYRRVFGRSWPSTMIRASMIGVVHLTVYMLVFWLILGYAFV